MQIIRSIEQLKAALARLRDGGRTIAFVPTMGALHAGHLSLVKEGRRRCDAVVASIFVNPKQFGAGEDLDRYPRREDADAALLEGAGCDLLWIPAVEDVYPPGFATNVHVGGVSDRWEGEARPGHFDGVATVVARLLIAVAPDVAIFGEKDFQQLAVIRRLASDLGLGVEIAGAETVRDGDGLALSSRNAYLTVGQREAAVALPRALESARSVITGGGGVRDALATARQALLDAGFAHVDYLSLVDSATLEPIEELSGDARLIAAASIGTTRLIDNLPVSKTG